MPSDALLGGAIAPSALAAKGASALSSRLLGQGDYVLVDRRDLVARGRHAGEADQPRPSFLRAAQALNADVVLRGSLQSFSTGKKVVDQGGYRTELSTAALRVSIEALDATDGTIVAMSEGAAEESFRQTAGTFTVLNEASAIGLLRSAVADALPDLTGALKTYVSRQAERPRVSLSVRTSDDPAMVEIDGLLVGSTPLEDYQVYRGDHVLTIGKAGHRDVSKRILLDRDLSIEVPLIRTELTADEMKDVLDKARMHIFEGEPGWIIHEISDSQ
jgi:hypothetical protein